MRLLHRLFVFSGPFKAARLRQCLVAFSMLSGLWVGAADAPSPTVELNQRAFFLGREYFVLRSGRAQMVVQADRADLGPAFTYLLFDAENASQSAAKERAFNYAPGQGFGASGLVVELGGFPFTALGHRTETRWVVEEGIPAVEAVWWAGGVRVTERICALSTNGVFRRAIRLEGAHLLGPESVTLRLEPAAGRALARGRVPPPEWPRRAHGAGRAGQCPFPGFRTKGRARDRPADGRAGSRGAGGYCALRSSPLRRPAGLA